jgi:4-amino-4-deoxy-L-arabinose transferase-like glycosyltransferase
MRKLSMNISRPFFMIAVVLLIIRFATLFVMGIMPQDAYYYFYGENLALSYFDHPPMIGWLLRLFTTIFGKSIFVVHLADFTVTLATVAVFYKLARRFLSEQKAANTLLLLFSTIMVSILSTISTPDVPLLLFWSLSLLYAHKAVTEDQFLHWVLAGVWMGCAFLSKYTAVFLPAVFFLFLLLTNANRKKIFNYRFLTTVIVFLIMLSPVVIWNVQHDFISFKFQGSSRAGQISFANIKPSFFFGTIGHQLFILLPVLFCALVFFLWKYVRKGFGKLKKLSTNNIFLLCFFLPVFLFFFGISILYWVKINWMMPAYFSGIIWAGQYIRQKWIKYQLAISLVLHVLAFVFIASYPVPVKSDDTWWGWNKLNAEVEQRLQSRPGYFLFAHDDYKTSAVLHFISGRKVYSGNLLGKPALQYMIVDKGAPQQLAGKNALFVDSEPRFTNEDKKNQIPPELQQYFETVIELEPILIKNKKGKTLRKFLVYECKRYKYIKP